MKKIIITLIFMISMVSISYAGPFVKFEFGPSLNVDDTYFVEGIMGYKFKFLGIESQTYGGWLTWAAKNKEDKSEYSPFTQVYSFNQKFTYKHVFIRFQHYCVHMVNNSTTMKRHHDENGNYMYTSYKPAPYWWAGLNRTLSIGFEYEFK